MDIAIAIKMGIQMDTQMATLMEIQAMETGNLLEITKSGIFSVETNDDMLCQQSDGISHSSRKWV